MAFINIIKIHKRNVTNIIFLDESKKWVDYSPWVEFLYNTSFHMTAISEETPNARKENFEVETKASLGFHKL